ncbi:MAG: ABC transporter ATP-binding protein [Hapalosiphonaceae cyanobacterium JJU2]|nr:MAG: ABC transporter ATP-binding protein [Hapalosiphonaceae cyanobacterium JJU2]
MNLIIEPYKGISAIKLGMTREEVRNILIGCGGELQTFMKTPTSEIPTDSFNNLGIHIFYKKPGICEAIEIFEPAEPVFMEINLLRVKFSELKQWFQKIDDEVEIDDTGLTSYKFGISLYAPSASEYPEEAVEAVIVFENGYYD